MDKRKIDQDVYEKYVDASVALFMEYYCATLSEDIHQEIDKMKTENVEFPDALDARCRATIKKECVARKRKQCLNSCVKGLRNVASVAIVLLALASVLFVSVEAIRVPIINYYISQNDQYLEFTSRQPERAGSIENINAEDPLAGLLPDGYELLIVDQMSPMQITAIYKSADGNSIYFSMDTSDAVVRVDAENTQTLKEIQIDGCKGMLVVKDGATTVTWGYSGVGQTFILTSSNLTEVELIGLAERFMQSLG